MCHNEFCYRDVINNLINIFHKSVDDDQSINNSKNEQKY